ncbi:EmrB/QacA subfamily drug resistance transporter [Kribbella orskensis]|uniref:EmrB/QacA subfamily drug resistance transporter n=1 Tax=Kribbella orskensis TaxID=2512216 RepID=A0ABY2BP10_9ACTN|nr:MULTISPECIES: MFS transporter [Kribbella]TCN42125.1 EmrB/QacA subfamily drug resistance transporter [Kribbella sp. VKM Ac-2500]TCO26003.1 EmrB/QacA subfamily drug resistance transporter [Kribbella orskensis]
MSGETSGGQQTTAADPRRWRLLALLGVAQFMLILDVTVVAIALPHIGAELGLARGTLTWVVSAYTLMFGGLMLLGGRAADLFGSRRIVLTGLVVFVAASLVTGLASGAEMLIGGRIAQGVGAALLSPAALSVVTKTFQGEERNKALGIWSALGGGGSAIGVLLGGVLTAGPGWQWVFYINVPIGVVVLIALGRTLPADQPGASTARLDFPGALLVTAGTGTAIYALINAGDRGWLSVATVGTLAVAAVLYAGFVALQRVVGSPLMDVRILTRRPVAAGTFLILVATALMIAVFFLGSFYLQHLKGYGALRTGLLFLPVALATIVGAQSAAQVIGRTGPRPVALIGLAIAAIGTALPAFWDSSVTVVVGISVAAAGIGASFVAASTTALSQVAHHEAGLASGILSTFHEFGAALGVAAVSSIAAASIAGTSSTGFTRGFTFAAITAAASAVLALFVVPAAKPMANALRHAH